MKQTKKLENGASFTNYLMANNRSIPKVGEYATFLHYTDRTVGIIREVSEDMKTVIIEDCSTVADGHNLCMGHQQWKHTPNGHMMKFKYAYGSWKKVYEKPVIKTEIVMKAKEQGLEWFEILTPQQMDALYPDSENMVHVPELTRLERSYHKLNILFGACEYYYDWSF